MFNAFSAGVFCVIIHIFWIRKVAGKVGSKPFSEKPGSKVGTRVGTKVGTFEGFEGYFSVLRKIKKARKPLICKGLRDGAGERNRTINLLITNELLCH